MNSHMNCISLFWTNISFFITSEINDSKELMQFFEPNKLGDYTLLTKIWKTVAIFKKKVNHQSSKCLK